MDNRYIMNDGDLFNSLCDVVDNNLGMHQFNSVLQDYATDVKDLISIFNKLDHVLKNMFEGSSFILDCTDEEWEINEDGAIILSAPDEDFDAMEYLATKLVGVIGNTACFCVAVYSPGTSFHEMRAGLLLTVSNYNGDFTEEKLNAYLSVYEDEDMLRLVLARESSLYANAQYCDYCGGIATVSTEDGWYCKSCNTILDTLRLKG